MGRVAAFAAEGGDADPRRAVVTGLLRSPALAGAVRTATAAPDAGGGSGARTLPVTARCAGLLPGGLRRGSTVALTGSTGLLIELLAGASGAGAWCAVVGLPGLSALAAADAGVVLDRLALVPHPGASWPEAVSALLDGFDLVVAAPAGAVPARLAGRLEARARQRGGVLIGYGAVPWPGADLVLEPERTAWHGLRPGRGRLRYRELTVTARGPGRPVRATLRLGQKPDQTGTGGSPAGTGAGVAVPGKEGFRGAELRVVG
ncbi:hypothetical protein R8Z50_25735 [Longispora sp. K20-0274]|uniref:hypothetical protein n=1 Tax=Longispora sp. K20-0274 TaxID=3088255 RepID=UPI00399B3AE1